MLATLAFNPTQVQEEVLSWEEAGLRLIYFTAVHILSP